MKNQMIIESTWVTGSKNFMRKPRYSLLLSINELSNYEYFELVKPNSFVYAPSNYFTYYKTISCTMDNIVQSFYTNTDLQKKVQDDTIKESYFRDLLKTGFSGSIGNNIRYVEKERETSSGRISDVYISVENGPDIPIETKLLWRFGKGDSYNPIIEVLEQTGQGNFGVTFVVNPQNSPIFREIYRI